jgi:hypothetical protein
LEPKKEEVKSSHWITTLSVAIFILLALGAIAFLYYQNQQLKNMLANYQPQTTSPPIPVATADPTADWKTYTNTAYNYSFKYPNNWNLRLFAGSQEQATTANSFAIEGPYQNLQTLQGGPDYSITITVVAKQPSAVSTPDKLVSSKVIGNNKYLEFDLISSMPNQTITDTQTFDQILSTFQFTVTASPTPAAQYTCPANGIVDCMPVLDAAQQKACSADAMVWYKVNCPNFQGGAY